MSAEVGISVLAVVTALGGGVGVEVAVVVVSDVTRVDPGVVSGVKVASGCVGEREGRVGGPPVVDVKVLVAPAVEVVGVGELSVSVAVTEDVTGGVEVIPVVGDSVEASLVGLGVVLQVDVA